MTFTSLFVVVLIMLNLKIKYSGRSFINELVLGNIYWFIGSYNGLLDFWISVFKAKRKRRCKEMSVAVVRINGIPLSHVSNALIDRADKIRLCWKPKNEQIRH